MKPKRGRPFVAEKDKEQTKLLLVALSLDRHRALKKYSKEHRMTMRKVIQAALDLFFKGKC
ncbi:MAG: hypothetical protein JSS79_05175 [Bacteroidetes bacterium]|nr:hypothetical protein [Bacteroidota bacterium]